MKTITTILSYLFHPLLALTYILLLIIIVNPFIFGSYNIGGSIEILAMTFFSTFLFPSIALLLLYKLDFIKDITMPSSKDRIVPLIIAMVCYYSVFAFLYKGTESPNIYQVAVLGACVNMTIAFLITIFYKISLHSIGAGAILVMTIYLNYLYRGINIIFNLGPLGHYSIPIFVLLFIVILLSGLVMSSRLYLKAHTPAEVYSGFFLGFIVQGLIILIF